MRCSSFVLLACLAASAAAAQSLPPATDGALLLPPDLRRASPEPIPHPAHRAAAAKRTGAVPAAPAPAARHALDAFDHPVDVGVVMRGGSSTPRLISPLGSTQAVRESGNAFGAGMRIGF
jgi:hypothetical protein